MQTYIGIDGNIPATKSIIYGTITATPLPSSISSATVNKRDAQGVATTDVAVFPDYDSTTGTFSIEGLDADSQYRVAISLPSEYLAPTPIEMWTAPADPTGVVVERSNGALRVSWDSVSDLTYNVIISNDGWGDVREDVTSPTEFTGLNNGSDYIVRITVKRMRDTLYTNTYMVPGTFTPTSSVLVMGAITATPTTQAVHLAWTPVSGADHYIVTTELVSSGGGGDGPLVIGGGGGVGGLTGTSSGSGTTQTGTGVSMAPPGPITVSGTADGVNVTGLVNGLEYQFSVVAYPAASASVGYSAPVTQTATPVALVGPSGKILVSYTISNGMQTLTPSGATGTVTSYAWYTSTDGVTYTAMNNSSAVIVVPNEDGKYYKVVAMNQTVMGVNSVYYNINYSTLTTPNTLKPEVLSNLTTAQANALTTSALSLMNTETASMLSSNAISALATSGNLSHVSADSLSAILATPESAKVAANAASDASKSSLLNTIKDTVAQKVINLASTIGGGLTSNATYSDAVTAVKSVAEVSKVTGTPAPSILATLTAAQTGGNVMPSTVKAAIVGVPNEGVAKTSVVPTAKAIIVKSDITTGAAQIDGGAFDGAIIGQTSSGISAGDKVIATPAEFVALGTTGTPATLALANSVLVSPVNAPLIWVTNGSGQANISVLFNQITDVTGCTVKIYAIGTYGLISRTYTFTWNGTTWTDGTNTNSAETIMDSNSPARLIGGTFRLSGMNNLSNYIFSAQLVGTGTPAVAGPMSVQTPLVRIGQTVGAAAQHATITPGDGTITISINSGQVSTNSYMIQILKNDGSSAVPKTIMQSVADSNTFKVDAIQDYTVFVYTMTNAYISREAQRATVSVTTAGPLKCGTVVATPGNGRCVLTWSRVWEGAASYSITCNDSSISMPSDIADDPSEKMYRATITGLTNNTTYTFTVRANAATTDYISTNFADVSVIPTDTAMMPNIDSKVKKVNESATTLSLGFENAVNGDNISISTSRTVTLKKYNPLTNTFDIQSSPTIQNNGAHILFRNLQPNTIYEVVTLFNASVDALPIVRQFTTGSVSIYLAGADVPVGAVVLNSVLNQADGTALANFTIDSAFVSARNAFYGNDYSDNMHFWRVYLRIFDGGSLVNYPYIYAANSDGVNSSMTLSSSNISNGTYTFKILLQNPDGGDGTVSDMSTFTLVNPVPAPDVTFNGGPDASIFCHFTSYPASVTHYNIAWSADGVDPESVEVSVASVVGLYDGYTIAGLDSSKTYTVTVTARQTSGGADSASVSAVVYSEPVLLGIEVAASLTGVGQIIPTFASNGCDTYSMTFTGFGWTSLYEYTNIASGVAIDTNLPPFGTYYMFLHGIKDGINSFNYSNTYTFSAPPGGAVCFLGDAPVLTARGYRPIREFRVGDKVMTADGREVAVTRVFSRRYGPSAAVNPYVIPKGVLGAIRPLAISPNHEVLVPGRGMIQARFLGLRRMKMAEDFVYYNLELEDWARDNLVVAGVTVESLAPVASITKAEFARFAAGRYGGSTAARAGRR